MEKFAFASIIGICMSAAGMVLAQTASEVVPDSFTPPLQNLNGAIVFSGETGTQAPPGAESIGITLSGVTIEGALPELAAENAAFRSRLTGGRIAVSELFEATSDLEEAYANAGLVLTRVVLPQQTLRDGGNFKVNVVSGFVENVDTTSVPDAVRGRFTNLTDSLVDRPGITLSELERQLLLAGDASGVALTTALAAGERLGGAVLALDAEHKRYTGFAGFDNLVNENLGRPVLNFGIEANSVLGLGETLYARSFFSVDDVFSDTPQYRTIAIGGLFSVGTSGLSVNPEITTSKTNPENDTFDTSSAFDRQSLRLAYPFIRSRNVNLTGQFTLEHQVDTQDLLVGTTPTAIYKDETTVLRFGATGSYRHSDTAISDASFSVSKGTSLLGSREGTAALPLSRTGADPEFSKLTFSARHDRALNERFSMSVSGRAQTSFGEPLLAGEQFGIVGPDQLSSFDAGALRGDSGYSVRSEVSMPIQTTISDVPLLLSPYVFAGFGTVTLAEPTVIEQETTDATAVGIGVDILRPGNSPFRADSVRIEFGKGGRDDGQDENRFTISGNFRF